MKYATSFSSLGRVLWCWLPRIEQAQMLQHSQGNKFNNVDQQDDFHVTDVEISRYHVVGHMFRIFQFSMSNNQYFTHCSYFGSEITTDCFWVAFALESFVYGSVQQKLVSSHNYSSRKLKLSIYQSVYSSLLFPPKQQLYFLLLA